MGYYAGDESLHFLVVDVVALHGVRFARAGLPVGHDGAIEPVQDVAQHRMPHCLVHLLLGAVGVEHRVEHEGYLLGAVGVLDYQLFARGNAVDLLCFVLLLYFVKGTETAEHFYVGCCCL